MTAQRLLTNIQNQTLHAIKLTVRTERKQQSNWSRNMIGRGQALQSRCAKRTLNLAQVEPIGSKNPAIQGMMPI